MIKFVGFDKDGTLINSQNDIVKEWGKIIYSDFGIDTKGAEKIFGETAVGKPTVVQLALTLKEYNISFPEEKMFEKANEIAIRLGQNVKASPFPEVIKVLKELHEKGYCLFISSSHQESVVEKDLKRTGIFKFIDYFVGARPNKPDFKKGEAHFKDVSKHFNVPFELFIKEAVFVGDTPPDIIAANDCNIISIAREGTLSRKDLLEAGAKFVIPNLSTLPEFLTGL